MLLKAGRKREIATPVGMVGASLLGATLTKSALERKTAVSTMRLELVLPEEWTVLGAPASDRTKNKLRASLLADHVREM